MANLTRNFTAGKMNKSVDERLIPNGEYVDALNIRMGSTENSEIGVIENSKGNTQLTTLEFNNIPLSNSARCIGAFEDGALENIYWFVHDPAYNGGICDMIVSYNTTLELITYHVISVGDPLDASKTILNFDPEFLITGVNKVEDLFFFTDNFNPPRQINVRTNYPNPVGGVDVTSAEALLVIRKPPSSAPVIKPIATSSQDNFLETRFVCFAYRYRYENKEYSATSQFSSPSFVPNTFDYRTTTALNEGMRNSTNQCEITYNSGGPLVKSVDLLFKDMNSSTIKVIEKLDKQIEGLVDNTNYTYTFSNSKIFTILPSSEILRLFDNVPLLSQAQTLMGNRVVYGNYVEGYDLTNAKVPTKFEYVASLSSEDVGRNSLEGVLTPVTYTIGSSTTIASAAINVDLDGLNLIAGASLNILIRFKHKQFGGQTPFPTSTSPENTINFVYILPSAFASVFDLANSVDFSEKIGTVANIQTVANACTGTTLTDEFNCILPNELTGLFKFQSGISAVNQPIEIVTTPSSSTIQLKLPLMTYVDDVSAPTQTVREYYEISASDVVYQDIANPSSLHSNRGYEIGIIYMDDFLRSTTALVSPNNTVHIGCSLSDVKNTIDVTIPATQVAPDWATRYKFCIKPDKKDYNIIYSNIFFTDPTSGADYFLLEGQNSQKIEEGDELIVKLDTEGPRRNCTFTTVLEKKSQVADFLTPPPVDASATPVEIPISSGVYMKIKANNFSTEPGDNPVVSYGEKVATGNNCNTVKYPVDTQIPQTGGGGNYEDYTIPQGSKISLRVDNERPGNEDTTFGNVPQKRWRVDLKLTASQEYDSFKEWFEGDNVAALMETGATTISCDGPNYTSTNGNSGNRPCNVGNIYTNFQINNAGTAQQRTYFMVKSSEGYGKKKKSTRLEVEIEVIRANGLVVFESLPQDAEPDLWYESSASYTIDALGQHSGNTQNQVIATNIPAIIKTEFFNCYAFGNGVESYKIQDSIIGKELVLGNRVTTTDSKEFEQTRRFADLTYSGVFNAESNINKLNEFNGGLLNFKALEQSFGPVMKLFGRETDILVLQEDRISYVLAGKNLLSDAGGGNALTSVPEVLGQQIARIEEYGISFNPESFAQFGPNKYFTDAKRGAALQLTGTSYSNDSLVPISNFGMRPWFRDLFQSSFETQKLGGFDPYMGEFVLSSNLIEIPQEKLCIACGVTQTIPVKAKKPYEVCYNLGQTVGDVDIDYSFASLSGTVTVTSVYNGVTNTTGAVTAGGKLVVNKNSNVEDELKLTVTCSDSVIITFTVACPNAEQITVVLVHLSSANDAGQQITDEFRYTDTPFISALHTETVVFGTGAFPIVSLFDSLVGLQGSGSIPTNGSTVTMYSNKVGTDDYIFVEGSDKFKQLRTSTQFTQSSADIASLLQLSTQVTPINPPANGNTSYNGSFTMPSGSDEYLYLIWDYRNSTPIDLCFGATLTESCCGCEAGGGNNKWTVSDCITGLSWTIEDIYGVFAQGDVVQYKQGIGAGQGSTINCGEIISTGTTVNATLYSATIVDCSDATKCNI